MKSIVAIIASILTLVGIVITGLVITSDPVVSPELQYFLDVEYPQLYSAGMDPRT